MPRRAIPLTDTEIRKSKPKDKGYKLFDGDGLYLYIGAISVPCILTSSLIFFTAIYR